MMFIETFKRLFLTLNIMLIGLEKVLSVVGRVIVIVGSVSDV